MSERENIKDVVEICHRSFVEVPDGSNFQIETDEDGYITSFKVDFDNCLFVTGKLIASTVKSGVYLWNLETICNGAFPVVRLNELK